MQPPNEEFFTLFSEARSDILAARSGSVIAAVAVSRAPMPIAAVLACETLLQASAS